MYNTVKVTLSNEEFNEISSKEVEVARYLDHLHQVRLVKDHDEITLQKVFQIAKVDLCMVNVKNNQNQPTPLCKILQAFPIFYFYIQFLTV